MQTTQPINENLEYLKASIPIFSVIAVVVAAYLNARFTRKQKVIDELFSYKVQAFMKVAEIVYLINIEYFRRFNHIKEEN